MIRVAWGYAEQQHPVGPTRPYETRHVRQHLTNRLDLNGYFLFEDKIRRPSWEINRLVLPFPTTKVKERRPRSFETRTKVHALIACRMRFDSINKFSHCGTPGSHW